MSILVLSKTAYAKSPFDVWLQEIDEDLIVLSAEKRRDDYPQYAHSEFFHRYEDNDMIELRALELYKAYPYRAIIATSEFDILRAGRLRSYLELAGQSYESAVAFRNKVVMKHLLQQGGVDVPPYVELTSIIDVHHFIKLHGFPAIIKPIYGSGSTDICILRSEADVLSLAERGIGAELEIESFVDGDMYHIDGLVLGGELQFCWPSKYINGCLAFQSNHFNGSYLLDETNPLTQRLVDLVKKILMLLPTPLHTSFHAEVFHTPDDRLVCCEIASRTGGGLIRETIQQGFGLDLTRHSVQAQCGMQWDAPPHKSVNTMGGFLLMPTQKGILTSIPEQYPEWVTLKNISANPGQMLQKSESSVDTVASFRVKGNSEAEVAERIRWLAKYVESQTKWEIREGEAIH